jgi:hypothetical protein
MPRLENLSISHSLLCTFTVYIIHIAEMILTTLFRTRFLAFLVSPMKFRRNRGIIPVLDNDKIVTYWIKSPKFYCLLMRPSILESLCSSSSSWMQFLLRSSNDNFSIIRYQLSQIVNANIAAIKKNPNNANFQETIF